MFKKCFLKDEWGIRNGSPAKFLKEAVNVLADLLSRIINLLVHLTVLI